MALEEKTLQFLESLYRANAVTTTLLAEELGIDVKDVEKFFKFLDFIGIFMAPDVMIHKLRLLDVLVLLNFNRVKPCATTEVLKGLEYLRFIAIYPPKSIYLTFYVPVEAESNSVMQELLDIKRFNHADVYLFSYVIRSKPLLEGIELLIRGDIEELISKKFFEKCLENPIPFSDDGSRPHIDSLDLAILNIVSRKPAIPLQVLTKELSSLIGKIVPQFRVRRHAVHASRFIYGYRVGNYIHKVISEVKRCYIVEGDSGEKLCRAVVRHPLSISCTWSDEYAMVCFHMPYERYFDFHINISEALQSYGSIVKIFEYVSRFDQGLIAVSASPFYIWNPKRKKWMLEQISVGDVVEVLRRYGCAE